MFLKQAFWFLVVVIGLCNAGLGLNISDCVKDCQTKFLSKYLYLCDDTCLQDALKKLVGKVTAKDYNRTLPKPVTPRLVGDPGWRTIRLHFNTTELKIYSDLNYILEVKPDWGQQQRNDGSLVFPYTKKYYHANQATYFVEDLEPNTRYQFRVIALKQNKSSPFSNWSGVINTTKSCAELPCGPTNILLELMARNRKRCQANENLINSTFRWEPDTTASEKNKTDLNQIEYTLTSLNHNSNCGSFSHNELNLGWDNASHSYDVHGKRLYFDCWYEIKTKAQETFAGIPNGKLGAKRRWIFHVPNCIQTPNGNNVSGCPSTKQTRQKNLINASRTRNTSDQTLTIFFNWTTELWENVNLGYFRVKLSQQSKVISEECIDASAKGNKYNMTIGNLTDGKKYKLSILAYSVHHCEQERVKTLDFTAALPCENSNCRVIKPNSICQEIELDMRTECKCIDGFYDDKKSDRCIEKDAKNNGLDKRVIAAAVVAPLLVILVAICLIFWLRKRHKKRMNFMEKEMELAAVNLSMNTYLRAVDVDMLTDDKSERVMNIIYVSQDSAYEIPAYLLEPINLLELPGDSIRLHSIIGRGEFGKVYVGEAHGINTNSEWTTVAIKTLTGFVSIHQPLVLSTDNASFKAKNIRAGSPDIFMSMVQTSNFWCAELNANELEAESASEEEVSDFLREIELMKNIGKHENVIEMYGCCTRCNPICLVLEYAPGGNLHNYLRSLKKKCKEIAVAQLSEVTHLSNCQDKRQYRAEAGNDVPEDFTSLLPNVSGEQNVNENKIKQAQDLNFKIASKINEEVSDALNPKELESFARQIATGMKHVSDLGIVHRDLAARNILIGENRVLKISDFGFSREGTYVKKTTGKIPFRWLSVEAMLERTYSTASDVWAFGVVLWEICTLGDIPYSSILDRNLKDFLLSGNRLEKVDSCTDDIYDIMLKCWSHLPEDRPTFDELTKKLWDLEHTGSSYVNLQHLLQQQPKEIEGEEKDQILLQESSGTDDKNGDNQGFHDEKDVNANTEE